MEKENSKPKIYGYARVSSRHQATEGNSLEAQEVTLRDAGADIIFKEAFTGTVKDRPQLISLLSLISSGDKLIVTKMDRLGRSIGQVSEIINDLLSRHVTIHILNLGILDNSPQNKLMRSMLLAFAEFERDMIVERTQEGKAIARTKNGFHEGRPRLPKERMDHAMDLLSNHSYRTVAKMTQISVSTLVREKRRRGL